MRRMRLAERKKMLALGKEQHNQEVKAEPEEEAEAVADR